VIPVHGSGPFLAAAVESALAEEPAEVIVVEDGTEEVDAAAIGGARLLRLPHVRRSRARNEGVAAAVTPYVAFLDEDDLCLAGRLARQAAALDAAPRAAMSYGRVVVVDRELRPIASWAVLDRRFDKLAASGTSYEAIVRLGGPLYPSAAMVRRDAFLEQGGFDPAFDAHEDLDLFLRFANAGGLVPTQGGPVALIRSHGANTTSDDLYRGTLAVTAKHLAGAQGAARAALLERRVDALWGLGEFDAARREVIAAARSAPRLFAHPRFLKRLVGLSAPTKLLEARR
jgi:GT2 family glycosyltransferase